LQSTGIKTLFANNGLQAIRIWQEQPVDLIILDYLMPELDGIETAGAFDRLR
jgi:CheY-like chemotaxis protein